ncbi:hypothetical protein KCV01_g25463, partial [Aureobasidium melanogenum]
SRPTAQASSAGRASTGTRANRQKAIATTSPIPPPIIASQPSASGVCRSPIRNHSIAAITTAPITHPKAQKTNALSHPRRRSKKAAGRPTITIVTSGGIVANMKIIPISSNDQPPPFASAMAVHITNIAKGTEKGEMRAAMTKPVPLDGFAATTVGASFLSVML